MDEGEPYNHQLEFTDANRRWTVALASWSSARVASRYFEVYDKMGQARDEQTTHFSGSTDTEKPITKDRKQSKPHDNRRSEEQGTKLPTWETPQVKLPLCNWCYPFAADMFGVAVGRWRSTSVPIMWQVEFRCALETREKEGRRCFPIASWPVTQSRLMYQISHLWPVEKNS